MDVSWQLIMMQNLKMNRLVVSRLTWGIWRILTRTPVSKICTLMCAFWPKYIMLKLKKYKGVIFDSTEDWCKIWHEEFCKSSQAEK